MIKRCVTQEGVELLGSQGINGDIQTSETDSTSEGDAS